VFANAAHGPGLLLPPPEILTLLLHRTLRHPLQCLAHAVPLRLAEDGAHVDEHHQLALEELCASVVHAHGGAADGFAIELRLIELGAQGDVGLLHLASEIDQLIRRTDGDRLQARLLIVGQREHLDHFRTAPPLPGRKVHRGRRRSEGEESESNESEALHQSFFPSSTHVSHCTTLWKSLSSSLCHGSCGTGGGSSMTGCGWTAAVVVTVVTCCGSTVRYTNTPPRKKASTAAAATRVTCVRALARS